MIFHRNPLRARIIHRLVDYRWSSYKVYAYGDKAHEWLITKPILSQLTEKDKHKAYREKVQRYAKEEKKLWEDLRHGLFMGSKKFVEKIRREHLPEKLHKEIPQQGRLSKDVDIEAKLKAAVRILGCDLEGFRQMPRVTKAVKDNRDILVLAVWKTGLLGNDEIGRLFGMTYSSVSHIIKSIRMKMEQDDSLKNRFSQVNSLFKM